ncbi:MAG: nitrilase [Deltaproteobacteria bacterium]|nr:nitrilase [Deltaproteobacteria bacterium]
MDDFRVAAVVMRCVLGETQDNLNRMKAWIGEAASGGANLVCFPELNLTGYSAREVIRSVAEPIPGPLSQAVVEMARESGMFILAGLVERDGEERIFASHIVAGPEGLQGVYRKCHLSPFEQQLYCAGETTSVFDVKRCTFGIELCYDTHFPELSTLLALKGAEIIFCLHASPRGTPEQKHRSWLRHLTARAYDNGVFVVACNQTGANGDGLEFPGIALVLRAYDNGVFVVACNQTGANGDGLEFPGIALVLNPSGEVIAEHVSGEEGVLFADLRAADLAHVRENRMRFFLPNRRPELYKGLIKSGSRG